MWIEIRITPDQYDWLGQFFAHFPENRLVMRQTDGILYYMAHTRPGAEGVPQINFLNAHQLAYINLENQRDQIIKDLFSEGAVVDGMLVADVLFPGVAEGRYKVTLRSAEKDTIVLSFPSDWRPPLKIWCCQTGICHFNNVDARQQEETS